MMDGVPWLCRGTNALCMKYLVFNRTTNCFRAGLVYGQVVDSMFFPA